MKHVALLLSSIGVGYFTMTEGWGLSVKSWPALIGGLVVLFVLSAVNEALSD